MYHKYMFYSMGSIIVNCLLGIIWIHQYFLCTQISGNILTAVGDPVDAADGVVSYYPAFAGFGDFIRDGKTTFSSSAESLK